MPWWAWALIGIAVGVPSWRAALRGMLSECDERIDVGALLVFGVLAILFFWTGPWFLIRDQAIWSRDAGGIARTLAGESRKAKRRRRKRELAAREAAIRQAERELGIGGDE